MPAKTKNRTGVGGRPQKKRKDPWEALTFCVLRRVATRYPELKNETEILTKDWERICLTKINETMCQWDFHTMARVHSIMRGDSSNGNEFALASAIRFEMRLLLNPAKYPPPTKTKIKDHLLAWLFLNPTISININGRKIEAITPFARLEAYEATPQPGDETIEINGFRVSKDDKPRNIVLVKYKSACMGEIAQAATKALGVEVSEKHITNLF